MRKLILIKHARPTIDSARPAREWELSDEGSEQSRLLAERLREHSPFEIVTSDEPKAQQTGQIIADVLGTTARSSPDLHEHDRENVPHMPTGEFISMMALFFKNRRERVLGKESADEAMARFSRAVEHVAGAFSGDVAIVSHGTVISLYAAEAVRRDAFQLWREMQLPSFVILEWPTLTKIALTARI